METILVISKSFEESKEALRGYVNLYKKDYPKDIVVVFLKKGIKLLSLDYLIQI